ncbi:MAG: HAD-IIIA family hydrolase [Lachnospiraceae bacterium]|nr:HAD-IIIA family hydrolase [Lachnospiraceae bacterium]
MIEDNKILTVIMAGGRGTRIAEYSKFLTGREVPKPMLPIDGIPVLELEIRNLVSQGFTDFLITVSYLADIIMNYFGDGSKFGCTIHYYIEETPLGNAGALWRCYDDLTDDFLLLNADSIFDIDFQRFVSFHREHGALATLFTHPNSHPHDSGLLMTADDGSGVVKRWYTKEDERPQYYNNRVNAGLHVLNKSALDKAAEIGTIPVDHIGETDADGNIIKVDLDRQILKPLVQNTDCVIAYDSPEYVKDMGTPERFEQVSADFQAGIVSSKNLLNPQKAIFLDRDGTVNKYVGFLRNIRDFELIGGAAESIARINASGYLCIVITNQPVIARGEVTVDELNEIHRKMETLLGKSGAYIDGLYYCPHHPDKGFEGEVAELKINCDCRKPKTGLINRAVKDFNIDISSSYFFGDGKNDIQCGLNAGAAATALYVGPGSESAAEHEQPGEYGQTYTVNSLNEFLNLIGV